MVGIDHHTHVRTDGCPHELDQLGVTFDSLTDLDLHRAEAVGEVRLGFLNESFFEVPLHPVETRRVAGYRFGLRPAQGAVERQPGIFRFDVPESDV